MRNPKGWLTTGQAAAVIGVSGTTVRQLCAAGALACWTVPGSTHRRVRRIDAEAYRDANRPPATTASEGPTVSDEPTRDVWRLDTPAGSCRAAVEALLPADLADCLVQFKLTPEKDRIAVYRTGGGETTPKLAAVLPAGAAKAVRLLLLGVLHDAAAMADGEEFAC